MEKQVLTGEELYKKKAVLKKIRTDSVNWIIYYMDEVRNEKWLEEYPYSEMQGGGPPQLRKIAYYPWEEKDTGNQV
jgi:hypothetical protein